MFTEIKIDNFQGIYNEICLNFIAKSRNKDLDNSVYKTEDGIYINRVIGIIGENAVGKSTILGSLCFIGSIMTSPIANQQKIKNLISLINENNKILKEDSSNYNLFKDVQDLYKEFTNELNGVPLHVANVCRSNDLTKFEIEMYIPNDNKMYEGYYSYYLTVSESKNIIVSEELKFRKKYKDKELVIFEVHDTLQSNIYYLINNYANIASLDLNMFTKEQFNYVKIFKEHYVENSDVVSYQNDDDEKKWGMLEEYIKCPDLFERIIKVIDRKINRVEIDSNDNEKKLKFYISDNEYLYSYHLSRGSLKFIELLTHAYEAKTRHGVILIDEIESSLNTNLIFSFLKLIAHNNSSQSQIIFTTHYPELFDK